MLFDIEAIFSEAQAITASAASENVIDLGDPGVTWHNQQVAQDVGPGKAKPIRIQVVEAFNNLTSLTVTVQVDSDSGFGSPKNVVESTIALADLVIGKVVPIEYVPRGTDERYMRLNYTVTGTDPTVGQITAGIVSASQANA